MALPSCLPTGVRHTQLHTANSHSHLFHPQAMSRHVRTAAAPEHAAAAAAASADSRPFQHNITALANAPLLPLLGSVSSSDAADILPPGPGVYAVLDGSLCVQYIGISRRIGDSLRSHVRELPQAAAFTKACEMQSFRTPSACRWLLEGREAWSRGSGKERFALTQRLTLLHHSTSHAELPPSSSLPRDPFAPGPAALACAQPATPSPSLVTTLDPVGSKRHA
ncbi:MAG: hypothetical protein WDW38_005695 [Sanguina aurantia]